MREALAQALTAVLGEPVAVERAALVGGGASKEAWAVDTSDGRKLLVRRAAGGVIHSFTLPLRDELRVLEEAHRAGVKVPEPYGYVADLAGREAFVMERVEGETIGRRIVKSPPAAPLDRQLAEELAKIHALPLLDFLPRADRVATLTAELDSVGEPHPAVELALHWLRERYPRDGELVLCHGDYRLGNLAVDERGIVAVLDWEFAHLGSPLEDLTWPTVRAWRFGMDDRRLAGLADVGPYLERYNELTGRDVTEADLAPYEIAGNAAWAIGCLTQARRHLRGEERSVELAVLGRMAAEVEYELLHLLERAA